MAKRTLTLLIEYEGPEVPVWLWDTHMYGKTTNGIYIKAICEGNQIYDLQNYFKNEEDDSVTK